MADCTSDSQCAQRGLLQHKTNFAGELCQRQPRKQERERVVSNPFLLPTRLTRNMPDDSTFSDKYIQRETNCIGQLVPNMDRWTTDPRLRAGYTYVIPQQAAPRRTVPLVPPMSLRGEISAQTYPNVPMPHYNARGELIPPEQSQTSFTPVPLLYTLQDVVPPFVRSCMRNSCRAVLPPQYIGMICKDCIRSGYHCPRPGPDAAQYNMPIFSDSALPRDQTGKFPTTYPFRYTPTPSKSIYPQAGDHCQQHENCSEDDEELILQYPEEPIVIDPPQVADNANTAHIATTIRIDDASEVCRQGATNSEAGVAGSKRPRGSSPRKRMRLQLDPQSETRTRNNKPFPSRPRPSKTQNSRPPNTDREHIQAERRCETTGCPERVLPESRWPRCTTCGLQQWKSRFGFRQEGKLKEKESAPDVAQITTGETMGSRDHNTAEHLGQTQGEGSEKQRTTGCEMKHDMQDVTRSTPLQPENEDNFRATLNEDMIGNKSDSQVVAIPITTIPTTTTTIPTTTKPTSTMGDSAICADGENIPAIITEGVEQNHSRFERHLLPQNDAVILAVDDTRPTYGSQDGSAMLKGWDSDLTDLSSNSDGESEIDMIESDDSTPKVKLTIRIPPRPFLAISQSSLQRKCSVKACKNRLELDYCWKMCAHCRAHARNKQKRKLGITSGHANFNKETRAPQGPADGNLDVGRGSNELPYTSLGSSETPTATLPSIPSTSANPDAFVPGLTDTRRCTSRRCRQPLPSFWEYRWKMCPSCRVRARLLKRKKKETIPPLAEEVGEVNSYVNRDKDPRGGHICEERAGSRSAKGSHPIQSRHVSLTGRGFDQEGLVALESRGGYRYCSNTSCEILLKSDSTSLECDDCQTSHPVKVEEKSSGSLRELKGAKKWTSHTTGDRSLSYSQTALGRSDELQKQRRNETSTPSSPYPQYQDLQSLISIFKARLDSFLEAQSFYMLYKLNDAGYKGSTAFRFDGEYSIVVPDFDIKGRAKQVETSVARVKESLENAGGFDFRVTSVTNSQSGGILTRMKCIRQVSISSASKAGRALAGGQDESDHATAFVKKMRGEVEVAVLMDFSHRFFPGERHIIRLRLVG